MKNELDEFLEGRTENFKLSLTDLVNDPFLARKEKMAIEFLKEKSRSQTLAAKKKKSSKIVFFKMPKSTA